MVENKNIQEYFTLEYLRKQGNNTKESILYGEKFLNITRNRFRNSHYKPYIKLNPTPIEVEEFNIKLENWKIEHPILEKLHQEDVKHIINIIRELIKIDTNFYTIPEIYQANAWEMIAEIYRGFVTIYENIHKIIEVFNVDGSK